jgi:hypothetical protein
MPYIIYTHFETRSSDPIACTIAGSLQLATTESETEAAQMTEMYKKRAEDYRAQYPVLYDPRDTSRYGYYFWPHPLIHSQSQQ